MFTRLVLIDWTWPYVHNVYIYIYIHTYIYICLCTQLHAGALDVTLQIRRLEGAVLEKVEFTHMCESKGGHVWNLFQRPNYAMLEHTAKDS